MAIHQYQITWNFRDDLEGASAKVDDVRAVSATRALARLRAKMREAGYDLSDQNAIIHEIYRI